MESTPLIMGGIEPWHWSVGGLCIGAITLTLLYVTNRRLGISTGFESMCALVSDRRYFRRSTLQGAGRWRLLFLGGLFLGGVFSAVTADAWVAHWNMGLFDTVVGWGEGGKLGWMFVGGAFIGLGTRMAGGCTSGHGIFGLSNFEPASWISTVSFMAAGVVTTNLIYRFVFVAGV